MEIRPINFAEKKYTYAQSTQLEGQTGSIGHLRGDFGSGNDFFSSWFDHRKHLKTDEFKSEFDEVINALRSDKYGLLKSRTDMAHYARKYPDSAFQGSYTTEYGFRVDTEKHAYLIRCNPTRGDYNFYCFCYVREWLDKHIEKANQDIRFISSDYKELFRLPDGEQITITNAEGAKSDFVCRYIDEAHLEVGNNLYHICEFAERMEIGKSIYAPKNTTLPPKCFSVLPSTGELIAVTRYEKGYIPIAIKLHENESYRDIADRRNEHLGVSKQQEAAMVAGSMFGWNTPAAQSKNYDENGTPIKPKNKDYER